MKVCFIVVNVFNHQLYTHQKYLSEMNESGVHFKFLFGPIYLFAYFLSIYSWLCLRARKKAPSAKKRSGCVSSEDGCRTPLYTFPLCQLIYSNGRRKWTRVHPHGSYCHSISAESCRDYSGNGSVKDNQKSAWLFQVLALVCIFPASFGTRVELLKAALNYLDISCMQNCRHYRTCKRQIINSLLSA